jgi:hypothetical protein
MTHRRRGSECAVQMHRLLTEPMLAAPFNRNGTDRTDRIRVKFNNHVDVGRTHLPIMSNVMKYGPIHVAPCMFTCLSHLTPGSGAS